MVVLLVGCWTTGAGACGLCPAGNVFRPVSTFEVLTSRIQRLGSPVLSVSIFSPYQLTCCLHDGLADSRVVSSGIIHLQVRSGCRHRWLVCLVLGSRVRVQVQRLSHFWDLQTLLGVLWSTRISLLLLSGVYWSGSHRLEKLLMYPERYASICRNETSSSLVLGGVQSCTALILSALGFHPSVVNGCPWKLKEQCHEESAVLGQFCAKIITFRL